MPDVILLSSDLMAWPQVAAAAKNLGLATALAANADALAELLLAETNAALPDRVRAVAAEPAELAAPAAQHPAPRLIIVDLSTPGLDISRLTALARSLPRPPAIVAYGPHVHEARLRAAVAAGCDLVLSRGQFSGQVATILDRFGKPA